MNWTYRPVLRNGAPVAAYTDATVYYLNRSTSKGRNAESLSDLMAANQRRTDLETALPRTPAQKLADLEQDSQGPDKLRRFYALNKLAEAALKAGDDEKAAAYARELLNTAPDFPKDWNFGNAIFDGHLALGLLAVRKDDVATARAELLESAKTPGSPTLNSFGPNMALAEALLRKGERGAVLEFLTSCGVFWKMGQERLQAWANTINQGGTPVFGTNLH
jgi:hypothetical protein